ncbi:MAG: ABC transporter permease [Clostridiales bacterium]|nr:ABC transporter permease [Clostridiales bacterium]
MNNQTRTLGRKFMRFLRGELGLLLILLLLCVVFAYVSPYFMVERNLLNITRQVSIVLTVAMGMLCVILSGEIDLSVGSTAALCGVAAAWGMKTTGNIWLGIGLALGLGLLVGIINGTLVVYARIPSFIVTLATMGILRGVCMVWTNGKPISNLPESFSVLGAGYVLNIIPVATVVSLLLVAVFYVMLQRTKHGTYIKAIGANREAATLSAIHVDRYKVLVFVAAGLMCAIGGLITTSKLLSAQPTANVGLEMDVLSGVILGGASLSGGIGTVVGTLLGSLTIGVINNGLNLLNVSSYYQEIVKGIIIIFAVVIKRNKATQ